MLSPLRTPLLGRLPAEEGPSRAFALGTLDINRLGAEENRILVSERGPHDSNYFSQAVFLITTDISSL